MGQGSRALIAHLDLHSFFVAVERLRRPELAGRAVVIGGRPGGRGLVAAASREARRAGVRPGMTLASASIRCPAAVFLGGAVDAYLAAASRIDDVLRRESTDIEWVSIDEAFFAIPAPVAPDAIERVQQSLHSMGFDAACGLSRSKIVAQIASRIARPRGIVHIRDGYEARFLAPLKIELLPDLDAIVARRLRARGVRRLGQLAHLEPSQATMLAGRLGAALARQAAGGDSGVVKRTPLPLHSLDESDLHAPTMDAAALRNALNARASRLARELRARGVYARSLTLRLAYADGRSESRTVPLPEPSALDETIGAAAADAFARMLRPDHVVRSIGLWASGLMDASDEGLLFPVRRA
jgi:DNA polymerase IV